MIPNLHLPELLIIFFVVLLLFGASRIGDIGGAFGRGIKEFRKATSTEDEPKAKAPKRKATKKG